MEQAISGRAAQAGRRKENFGSGPQNPDALIDGKWMPDYDYH